MAAVLVGEYKADEALGVFKVVERLCLLGEPLAADLT